MRNLILLSSLILVLVLFGCQGGFHGKPSEEIGKQDFDARISAAQHIDERNQRNDALKTISLHAAEAGELEYLKRSISDIDDRSIRNSLYERCAVVLSKKNMVQEAIQIAQNIDDRKKRNKVMSKIAKGSGQ